MHDLLFWDIQCYGTGLSVGSNIKGSFPAEPMDPSQHEADYYASNHCDTVQIKHFLLLSERAAEANGIIRALYPLSLSHFTITGSKRHSQRYRVTIQSFV